MQIAEKKILKIYTEKYLKFKSRYHPVAIHCAVVILKTEHLTLRSACFVLNVFVGEIRQVNFHQIIQSTI